MTKYLNIKFNGTTETVDQLDRRDFKTYKDFIKEVIRLKNEYHISGMQVYISRRCTKDWNN